MKSSKRKIAQVVALVVSSMGATLAMAGTPSLLGGGSTLVAPTIATEITAFPAADGSVTYSPVGSGGGQTAFLSNSPTALNTTGVTFASTLTVDFANSDAALTSAQISAYAASTLGAHSGALIQLPYVVTPITIPLVNAPAGTGPQFPSSIPKTVALNDADLCGIFSGKLTNWNQVTNPSLATPALYTTNAPITVVYRTDNSGTTDLLTRHLQAVCSSANSAITFTETQGFAGLFTTVPTHFIGASGSGGVAAELASLASAGTAAVGYLSPDYTNTLLAKSSAQAQANKLAVASLLNSHSNVIELPTFVSADNAVASVSASIPSSAAAASLQTNWVPASGDPSVGYPISGTSQIIVSQCYANAGAASPSPAQAIVDFLTAHYADTTVVNGNGFDIPTAYLSAITADFLSDTSNDHLNIGNTAVCTGSVTGR